MMMYLNTIYRFGTERFFDLCNECGIQGVIVPDMPYEEKDEIQGVATAHGVDNISLVTPTSHDRIAMIAKEAEGFLYCVSSIGVTGTRSEFTTDFDGILRCDQEECNNSLCSGIWYFRTRTGKENEYITVMVSLSEVRSSN